MSRYLGAYKLSEVGIPEVRGWMAQMVSEGYAPRSVSKPYGVLRQAMKHAVALDRCPCRTCCRRRRIPWPP